MSKSNPKPIKILFDASPLLVNKTGIAYYIERIITNLAAEYPNDVELVGFYYNFLGRKQTEHFPIAPNLHYHEIKYIPSKVLYQLRRWGIELPIEFLARARADFIFYPNILSWPSWHKTPSAAVIHDVTYLDLPEYVSAKLRSDLTRFVPETIARSAFTVAVSDFTKQRLVENYHLAADNILVTPIPPAQVQENDQKTNKAMVEKAGVQKPFILFVGTVEPRKNIGQLVEAYKALSQELREQYSLVIVGRTGWYYDKVVDQISQAQTDGYDVIHLGYVEDSLREALFAGATLFSTASHYEGFGMPVLEAMSHGVPSAVSNLSVFHEVAGDSVRYFDQDDTAAVAECWRALLTHPNELRTLGEVGLRQARSLSWKPVVTSLYERISLAVSQQK